jgi:DNA-directed RNA polymerase subunit RPC12/RpoP
MDVLTCADCGRTNRAARGREVPGFGSAITHDGQSRVYCEDCRHRRGAAFIFDPRPFREIAAEQLKRTA